MRAGFQELAVPDVASTAAANPRGTPPFTALMAWLMFGEELSLLALAGMAVCVAGVALVNWRTGPQPA